MTPKTSFYINLVFAVYNLYLIAGNGPDPISLIFLGFSGYWAWKLKEYR